MGKWHLGKPELVAKYEKKIKAMELTPTYRIDPKTGSKLTSETNAVYAAMIESVDDSVGRIVDKLKKPSVPCSPRQRRDLRRINRTKILKDTES